MMSQYLLGFDAGTSLVKSVIFNLAGDEVGAGTKVVETQSPQPGWVVQDMELVWQALVDTIQAAMKDAGVSADQIVVVCPSGQGDGAWMIDAAGEPVVAAAPLWNDNRAANILSEWEDEGVLAEIFKLNGTVLWAGSQAGILKWYQINEPKTLEKVDTVFCCKDWLKYKLTGVRCTDLSDSAIPFMDMVKGGFSHQQMALLGLEMAEEWLPEVIPSHKVIGRIKATAAEKTGLQVGTPVVSGMLDVAANAVGIGVINGGQSFSILGTTALNAIVMDQPNFDPVDIGATVYHGVPDRWMRVLGTMTGTPNLDWYLENLGEIFGVQAQDRGVNIFDLTEAAVNQSPVGARGVIYHPFLNGERAPFLNPNAMAGFYGLRASTGRNDMLRAVYEGVALSVRDCFEKIKSGVEEAMLSGGGSNSPAWCQILSDVTGSVMKIPSGSQFGAKGAAMSGAIGVGIFSDYEQAVSQFVRVERTYEPNLENTKKYDEQYLRYSFLISQLASYWEMCTEKKTNS